jgi:hypothetical protein
MVTANILFSSTLAAASHILDGPLQPTWSLLASTTQAALKAGMSSSAPQGRHSMKVFQSLNDGKVVRFATDNLTIPAFIVEASITAANTTIALSEQLCSDICNVVGALKPSIVHKSRILEGEFVLGNGMALRSNMPIILYLHGGMNFTH